MERLTQIDKALTLAINGLHTPFTDGMWVLFSGKTVWIPLYLLVIALIIWRLGWRKGLIMILTTVLCILCVDQFANLIKASAQRLRPGCDPEMLERGLYVLIPSGAGSYGFFSAQIIQNILSSASFAHGKVTKSAFPASFFCLPPANIICVVPN